MSDVTNPVQTMRRLPHVLNFEFDIRVAIVQRLLMDDWGNVPEALVCSSKYQISAKA